MNAVLVVNLIHVRFSQKCQFGLIKGNRLNREGNAGENVIGSRSRNMLLLRSVRVKSRSQLALRRWGLRVQLVRVTIRGDRMVCDFFKLLQQMRIVLRSLNDFVFVGCIEMRVAD